MSKLESAVYSTIRFPLGQDALSITKAVNDLLKEGWDFTLKDDGIEMSRTWRIYEAEGQVEMKDSSAERK